METLVLNSLGTAKIQIISGEEFLVAPAAMIVPGILNGSAGPVLYSSDMLKRVAPKWNDIPIVINHPMVNGMFVSAKSEGVLDAVGVGSTRNAAFNGKLVAETVFNVAKLKQVDFRVYNALVQGIPVELSTGLNAVGDASPGEFDGIPYRATITDMEPDHLAVLPDVAGACSLKGGCGILVNSSWAPVCPMCGMQMYGDKCDCGFDGQPLEPRLYADMLMAAASYIPPLAVKSPQLRSAMRDMFKYGVDVSFPKMKVANELSAKALQERDPKRAVELHAAAREEHTKLVNNSAATAHGAALAAIESSLRNKGRNVDKAAKIAFIVANCDCWKGENEQKLLTTMTDAGVDKLHAQIVKINANNAAMEAAAKSGATLVLNAATGVYETKQVPTAPVAGPKNFQEWMAQAPPEAQAVFNSAMEIQNREKTAVITRLVANKAAGPERDSLVSYLQSKPLPDLKFMESLLPPVPPAPAPTFQTGGPLTNFFAGPGVAPSAAFNGDQDLLIAPKIDWSAKA